ncbi:MAG TPA: hypothetical protein VJY62_17550 [Bacteroidia bacterium]|nr:hypothetical protein [Bacteroidia bacterium]
MKNKKTISKLFAAAVVLAATVPVFAQTDLGAECGCPTPVSSRPTVNVSTLATSGGALDGELTAANTIFTCDKTWILDKKIYVPNGKTLTIQPGTVIKGNTGTAANATALTVEVGGKIFASGTEHCQIVFTAAADNLNGSFPIASNGQWGGVCIAGKASNNLTLAANGPFQPGVGDGKLCVADGIGTFEGFASSNSKDQFGVTPASFDDNDNSGILRYVSIRHAGAILQVGGELNGLSLGSVGRGTTIDHVEIVSCADDGIEIWGGTVNLKHITMLFGNDDNLDWDDGWRGKAQFVFVLKTDNTASVDSDNGMECDADDQKSNLLPRSHPVIFNATMIGNSKTTLTSDNSSVAAINAKELTEGEIYNSVFANWKNGFNTIKSLGSRTGTSESYHNWSATLGNGSQSLKVKCNTFINVTNPLTVGSLASGTVAADNTQFTTTDNNISVASVSGFDYGLIINNTTNAISHNVDAVPNPALSTAGCASPPSDGFYTPAAYRGAFAESGQNWLSDWTYSVVLGAVSGVQDCPTDINQDGITNNIDFLQLLGQFNQNCQ